MIHPGLAVILLLLGSPLWIILVVMYRERTIPYYNLPGPPPDHWLFGNLLSMINLKRYSTGQQQMSWIDTYGSALRYTYIFRRPQILISDLTAIDYVYHHSDEFDQLETTKEQMRSMTGDSVITASGEQHKRLRRVMFQVLGSPETMRHSFQVFLTTAAAFVDQLTPIILPSIDDGVEIDAFEWCNRITMDIIGLAGFGYRFQAVSGKRSQLLDAWMSMVDGFRDRSLLALLMFTGWIGSRFPMKSQRQKAIARARDIMRSVGRKLLNEKRMSFDGVEEAEEMGGGDMLGGLLKASTGDNVKLSDEELSAQVPLLLLAGNLTTAATLTWAFVILAQNPHMQKRLREEILSTTPTSASSEAISQLPYLEAFVKELLRMYPAVPTQFRQALKETVIPLRNPVRGRDGTVIHNIHVNRGTSILISSLTINLAKDIWGEDAEMFRPERHLEDAVLKKRLPGVWGDVVTFAGGARSCLGYRFAIMELKTVLFVVLQHLSFHEVDSKPRMERYGNIGFSRIHVIGEEGVHAPIKVRLYTQ